MWPASMTLLTIRPCAEASSRRLMKPGPATSAEAMPSACGQRVGEPSGQLARVGADLLGELQRQVAGVVAVLGVAWPLDGDRRRQCGGVERMLGQHRGRGGPQQLGQVGGIHAGHPIGCGGLAPNPFRCPACRRDALVCRGPLAQHFRVRPRSSGDRASASGAEGRRFESCRGHRIVCRSAMFLTDSCIRVHSPCIVGSGTSTHYRIRSLLHSGALHAHVTAL